MSLQELKEQVKQAVDACQDEALLLKLLNLMQAKTGPKGPIRKATPEEEELILKSEASINRNGTRSVTDLKTQLDARWPG